MQLQPDLSCIVLPLTGVRCLKLTKWCPLTLDLGGDRQTWSSILNTRVFWFLSAKVLDNVSMYLCLSTWCFFSSIRCEIVRHWTAPLKHRSLFWIENSVHAFNSGDLPDVDSCASSAHRGRGLQSPSPKALLDALTCWRRKKLNLSWRGRLAAVGLWLLIAP